MRLQFKRAGFRTYVARVDHQGPTYRIWGDGVMWHLSIDGQELESSPWRLKRHAVTRAESEIPPNGHRGEGR